MVFGVIRTVLEGSTPIVIATGVKLARMSRVATLAIGCIFSTGCESGTNGYLATVRSAREAIPEAVEIEKQFGSDEVDHFITYYGMSADRPVTWNTEVFFGGRYTLTMQVPVNVDYQHHVVEPVGDPRFWLIEATQVDVEEDGRISVDFGRTSEFGPEKWRKVVESDGNFAAAGIELNSKAVPDFSRYVEGVRRDRAKQHVALLEDKNRQNRVKQPRSE